MTSAALVLVVLVTLASGVGAAPLVYDFRQAQYDPQGADAITAVQAGMPTVTVRADAANSHLHWDSTDGFGINGPSYSDDEVEGSTEVLRVTFDQHVRIIGIGLSDLFYESEWYAGAPPCYIPNWPTCYREIGQYSYDGGASWLTFMAPFGNIRQVTNGEFSFGTFLWTNELLFRAPGAIAVQGFPYQPQLHEFSLQSLTLKPMLPEPVPEPATLALLGAGLLCARAWRKRD